MYLFTAADQEQKRHRAIRVLWSQRYYCHRQARRGTKGRSSDGEPADNDEDEDDDYDNDGVQRRPVQKKSKHLDCKAHLIVKCFKDTPDAVDIAYIGEHTGHIPGIEDVQFLHKSDELNEQILQELRKGYNVRDVRRYLQRVYRDSPRHSRNAYISTVDVYNIYCKYRQEKCTRNADDFESVDLFLGELEASGYHIWIDTDGEDTDDETPSNRLLSLNGFTFSFIAPWQKQLFPYAQYISLDATHDVCFYNQGVLYTMVIRDPVAGRGVPIAYLLTDDQSSTALSGWFRSLASIGLNPQCITIDRSLPEDNAIVEVWPSCTIQHCIWHVMRAWMTNVQSKITSSVGRTAAQARAHIRLRLRELMYEENQEQFHLLLDGFLAEIAETQTVFSSYFRQYYVNSFEGEAVERWAKCYQPAVFTNMETNNYVESWHNQLKTHYLKRKRMHRLDLLIELLTDDVAFDITKEIDRLSVNIGRMSASERYLRNKEQMAQMIDRSKLRYMVTVISDTSYLCCSFTESRTIYDVSLALFI